MGLKHGYDAQIWKCVGEGQTDFSQMSNALIQVLTYLISVITVSMVVIISTSSRGQLTDVYAGAVVILKYLQEWMPM